MSQGLKPCPDCGSIDVEICSGDAVLCNECGFCLSFDEWQAEDRSETPDGDGDIHDIMWPSRG